VIQSNPGQIIQSFVGISERTIIFCHGLISISFSFSGTIHFKVQSILNSNIDILSFNFSISSLFNIERFFKDSKNLTSSQFQADILIVLRIFQIAIGKVFVNISHLIQSKGFISTILVNIFAISTLPKSLTFLATKSCNILSHNSVDCSNTYPITVF
jgi:hypothetical protein